MAVPFLGPLINIRNNFTNVTAIIQDMIWKVISDVEIHSIVLLYEAQ